MDMTHIHFNLKHTNHPVKYLILNWAAPVAIVFDVRLLSFTLHLQAAAVRNKDPLSDLQ